MHRFYVPPAELKLPNFALPEAEARHAAQVLRVKPGEIISVLDGAGRVCECEVESVERRQVWVKVLQDTTAERSEVIVEVYPAVAKGKAMDFIIQKVSELGANRICPLVTEHSVAQLEGERAEEKTGKWRQTAVETLKQCGHPWLPEIAVPVAFKDAFPGPVSGRLDIVAALLPDTTSVRHCLDDYVAREKSLPSIIGLWVGPEGDYSPAEYALMKQHQFRSVSLGTAVLRCETAVLALLAVCQHEIQCRP